MRRGVICAEHFIVSAANDLIIFYYYTTKGATFSLFHSSPGERDRFIHKFFFSCHAQILKAGKYKILNESAECGNAKIPDFYLCAMNNEYFLSRMTVFARLS